MRPNNEFSVKNWNRVKAGLKKVMAKVYCEFCNGSGTYYENNVVKECDRCGWRLFWEDFSITIRLNRGSRSAAIRAK